MANFKNNAVKSMVVMRKAFRTIDARVSESFKFEQLKTTQIGVLFFVFSKRPMKKAEQLDSMLATSGNMTVVIRNMEKKGWVTRTTCPHDKRAYLVGLTEQGCQVIEHALPLHIAKIEETFSVLTEDEQAELIRLLKKFKPCEQNNLQNQK